MEIIKTLQEHLDNLEIKQFYLYLSISIAIIVTVISGMGWYYFRTTHEYLEQIQTINELRENDIKDLFTVYQRMRAEQKQVNALLAQDPNFKIADYFDKLLGTLGLTQKNVTAKPSPGLERDKYREKILNTTFEKMNMQELCTLLQALEESQRIFTKELNIKRSKKANDTIDVTLIIATLQPKVSS